MATENVTATVYGCDACNTRHVVAESDNPPGIKISLIVDEEKVGAYACRPSHIGKAAQTAIKVIIEANAAVEPENTEDENQHDQMAEDNATYEAGLRSIGN